MNVNYSMDMKQTQKLQMTKELKQAIELLNMNSQEVEGLISEELKENPILESEAKSEIEWDKFLKDLKGVNLSNNTYYEIEEENNLENYITEQINIYDHLERELCGIRLSKKEKLVAFAIIERVNEAGYFTEDTKAVSEELSVTEAFFLGVLKKVQECEPVGICARNLSECLKLQLEKTFNKNHIIFKIVENDLEDIGNKKYTIIQKKYKLRESELSEMIKIIKGLEPKPGRMFSDSNPHYILPDIKVEKLGEKWEILNNQILPEVKINQLYANMLLNKDEALDKEAEKYIKEKLNRAVNLIKNIEQRKNTINKVATKIIESQQDFFEKGKNHMVPMRLKDIAEATGFHESTISRAVNGKYMQTPKGVFEFKYFFTTSISTVDGNHISNKSIKLKIKEIIETEKKKKPISDQKISELLTKDGVTVSRRTITKYREEMGIPSSTLRKEI